MNTQLRKEVKEILAQHEEQDIQVEQKQTEEIQPKSIPTIKDWKLITRAEKRNVDFLIGQKQAYEAAYGLEGATAKVDYKRIVDELDKLQSAKERELQAVEEAEEEMANMEKRDLALELLNPRFRKYNGLGGTVQLVKIQDEEQKIVKKIIDPKAMREQLQNEIADIAVTQNRIYSPHFIFELAQYWERYGEKVDTVEIYGGFDAKTWCLGRANHVPKMGPMLTWENFLSRMNDPDAFAAWVYGIASKRYRGRQVLWLEGNNGEDGKSFIQKLVVKGLFPNVAHAMANTAFSEGSARFIGAEFENKTLAYWDDCNNTRALFREDVKALSSGAEGNPARIEHKGVGAYNNQLETRMWINSNHSPAVSHDNFILSRLLYIKLAPMTEEPDVNIGEKFNEEFAAFLWYGEQVYNSICTDNRKIIQNDIAKEMITNLADDTESDLESVLTDNWVVTNDEKDFVPCKDIQRELVAKGIRDNFKQRDWYLWLERRRGLKRSNKMVDGRTFKVVTGLSFGDPLMSRIDWVTRKMRK